MIAANQDLTIYRGLDFAFEITCQDSNGAAINLTGYTFKAQVRHTASGALIQDLAPQITNAAGGVVSITLTDTQTLALNTGTHVWDLVYSDGDSIKHGPLVAGKFTIAEPVSKFS